MLAKMLLAKAAQLLIIKNLLLLHRASTGVCFRQGVAPVWWGYGAVYAREYRLGMTPRFGRSPLTNNTLCFGK